MRNTPLAPIATPRRNLFRVFVVLLCSLVILSACSAGEDDEGHQFANDPKATKPASQSTEPPTPEVDEPVSTMESTPSAAELLVVRGAPKYTYVVVDGRLGSYEVESETFTPLELPQDTEPMGFASSPTGDRVSVLGWSDQTYSVQFFTADGKPISEPAEFGLASATTGVGTPEASPVSTPVASPMATPTSSRSRAQLTISWVPQGDAVVVAGPGVLNRISIDGSVMPISRAGTTGMVVFGLWSPMDSQVALLTQQMDGHQNVFMLDSGSAEANELEPLQLEPGQSLSNLQWLPNGLGVVFVIGDNSPDGLMNGQLYVYKFKEAVPTLLATSGQGGPAGTISHAVVSPDGSSITYAVMVHDQHEWHLHSLWVKPIAGGNSQQIHLDSNASITQITWTAEGLMVQQSNGDITILDGAPDDAESEATPTDSPVGSPDATPVSSPVPHATPQG